MERMIATQSEQNEDALARALKAEREASLLRAKHREIDDSVSNLADGCDLDTEPGRVAYCQANFKYYAKLVDEIESCDDLTDRGSLVIPMAGMGKQTILNRIASFLAQADKKGKCIPCADEIVKLKETITFPNAKTKLDPVTAFTGVAYKKAYTRNQRNGYQLRKFWCGEFSTDVSESRIDTAALDKLGLAAWANTTSGMSLKDMREASNHLAFAGLVARIIPANENMLAAFTYEIFIGAIENDPAAGCSFANKTILHRESSFDLSIATLSFTRSVLLILSTIENAILFPVMQSVAVVDATNHCMTYQDVVILQQLCDKALRKRIAFCAVRTRLEETLLAHGEVLVGMSGNVAPLRSLYLTARLWCRDVFEQGTDFDKTSIVMLDNRIARTELDPEVLVSATRTLTVGRLSPHEHERQLRQMYTEQDRAYLPYEIGIARLEDKKHSPSPTNTGTPTTDRSSKWRGANQFSAVSGRSVSSMPEWTSYKGFLTSQVKKNKLPSGFNANCKCNKTASCLSCLLLKVQAALVDAIRLGLSAGLTLFKNNNQLKTSIRIPIGLPEFITSPTSGTRKKKKKKGWR